MEESKLVDRIYECAFIPELWPEVLDSLAVVGGAVGGVLFTGNYEKVAHWTASEILREPTAEYAGGDLIRTSERLPRVLAAGHAGFVGDLDIYQEHELASDPMYRDFLWPRGLGWAAGMGVAMPTGDSLVLSLERAHAAGPVDADTVRKLNVLRPHVARSAFLAARQHLERARAASDTLAMIGLPAIVMDAGGKVLSANRLAEDLTVHVRWGASDRFFLKDRNANDLLEKALATIHTETQTPVRSFAVRNVDMGAAFVAHILPLRGSARDVFVRSAAVLVMTPVTMPQAPPVELIQSLFDLTPAEARVARMLTAGDTVEEIATGGQVSRDTVRTQLRGVLGKTGCRRQAEVVALLSGVALPGGASGTRN